VNYSVWAWIVARCDGSPFIECSDDYLFKVFLNKRSAIKYIQSARNSKDQDTSVRLLRRQKFKDIKKVTISVEENWV
jgi:hypothetical protein